MNGERSNVSAGVSAPAGRVFLFGFRESGRSKGRLGQAIGRTAATFPIQGQLLGDAAFAMPSRVSQQLRGPIERSSPVRICTGKGKCCISRRFWELELELGMGPDLQWISGLTRRSLFDGMSDRHPSATGVEPDKAKS